MLHSPLTVELNPSYMVYGGIYGGNPNFSMFVPEDAEAEEITPQKFSELLLESLRRNYVEKNQLESLTSHLLKVPEDVDAIKILAESDKKIASGNSDCKDYLLTEH